MSDPVVFAGNQFEAAAKGETAWVELDRTQAGDMTRVMTRVIEYGGDTHLFRVTVRQGEISLVSFTQSNFAPRFGIDVSDMAEINEVSERMAVTLD